MVATAVARVERRDADPLALRELELELGLGLELQGCTKPWLVEHNVRCCPGLAHGGEGAEAAFRRARHTSASSAMRKWKEIHRRDCNRRATSRTPGTQQPAASK